MIDYYNDLRECIVTITNPEEVLNGEQPEAIYTTNTEEGHFKGLILSPIEEENNEIIILPKDSAGVIASNADTTFFKTYRVE